MAGKGRIAEEAEARDGARRALPRLQSVSPQSAPAGGPSSGREAQASAREAERQAPIPAGVGPSTLWGTCGASAAHAAWALREGGQVLGCPRSPPAPRASEVGLPRRWRGPGRVQGAIFSGSCSPSRTDRTS